MKYIKIVLAIIVMLFVFGCNPSAKKKPTFSAEQPAFSKQLDAYFQALTNLKKFNGVVLVQREGERIHFEAYNMQEDKTHSLYIDKQAQFDIHSISKLMAKAAIIDLEQANLLSRKDKVSKFIKDFPSGDKISIQHLMDNQSGLPRGFTKEIPDLIDKKPEAVVALVAQEQLVFEPGSETMYSNLGYQLLYFIIAEIANKPFVQYLNEHYFDPLEMKHTGAHFHLADKQANNLVKNHEENDGEIVIVPNIQSKDKNQAKIYSSVEDLLLFINYLKSETYLSKIKNKNHRIGWSGGGDGILSHAEYCIAGNYELVFFSNYDEIPFGDIVKTVEKIMTNKPYELPQKIDRKSIKLNETILQRYEGKYRVKEFNNSVFEYRIEKGQLVMYQDGERGGILYAETDRTFFDEPDAADYFEFRRADDGSYDLIFHYKKIEIVGKKFY